MKMNTQEYEFVMGLMGTQPNLSAGDVGRILTILRSV